MADLSVIVTTADGLNYTKNCLRILLPQMGAQDELIVVDDASTDGTPDFLAGLRDVKPAVKIIARRQRQGQPAAINRGLQESTGREVLILHNDTYLLPDTVARLREALAGNPRLGAVSPMALRSQSVYTRMSERSYHNMGELAAIARAWEAEIGDWQLRHSMVLDDYCLLLRREALLESGGFDSRYSPRYLAAEDLSLRFWQAGWQCAAAAHLVVHHEAQRTHDDGAATREWYRENQRRFEKKWGFTPTYSLNVNPLLVGRIDVRQPGLSVLDVGCAGGGNLMRLAQLCPDSQRHGIELNAGAARIAACFGEVVAADITQIDRPDWEEKFSYILCGDLIEHLAYPLPAVKMLGRFLKPGTGRLFVSLPNVLHFTVWRELLAGKWTYQPWGILDRTHLRFFTKESALAFMAEAGLTARVVGRNAPPPADLAAMEPMLAHILQTPGTTLKREDVLTLQWIIEARRPEE